MTPESEIDTVEQAREHSRDAAKILLERGENVIAQCTAAQKPDNADGIHDLRVAIRRLRTAMRDLAFRPDKKEARRLDEELKSIAAFAGKVRDHDVALDVLAKLSAETNDAVILSGLDEMITGRRKRREADLESLAELLTAERIEQLSGAIRSVTAEAAADIKKRDDAADPVIRERRSAFLELAPCLYDPMDIKGHHKLRIAAKRLRYSVELFDRTPSGTENTPPEQIAIMQDHLGDMHDCDVWTSELRKNLKKYLKKGGETTPEFLAAEWLLGEFVRRRAKNYREALELWTAWRNGHFLESLTPEIRAKINRS